MEFIKNNRKTQVFARKEVIVSAGAINSPTLLMLSGIGPMKHLEDLGVSQFRGFVIINRNHKNKSLKGALAVKFLYLIYNNVKHSPNYKKSKINNLQGMTSITGIFVSYIFDSRRHLLVINYQV